MVTLALTGGCDDQSPRPQLDAVVPQRMHSDRALRLQLIGAQLVPLYRFELDSGKRHADASGFTGFVGIGAQTALLRDFAVVAPGTLEATLDPGLPAGTHDVVLTDPRGARAILAGGYTSLGLDTSPPVLSIAMPTAEVQLAPGAPVTVQVVAEDDSPLFALTWQASGPRGAALHGTCPVSLPVDANHGADPRMQRVVCDFNFVVPADLSPGDSFQLLLSAIDGTPRTNRATLSRSFRLLPPPTIRSVESDKGGAAGGTDVVIRGSGFGPGSVVRFGASPLLPGGGILLDESTIVGKTPPHPAGRAVIQVTTTLGAAVATDLFEYLAVPVVASIQPARGPASGGQLLRVLGQHFTPATRIFLGVTLATARPLTDAVFVDATEIRGLAPPGHGDSDVFAVDPTAGWAALPVGFRWEAAGAPTP